MPVSKRSVSADGTSMWRLSTNRAPRRRMIVFASVTRFSSNFLTLPRPRAQHAVSAGVTGRRRLHLSLAGFGDEERILQPGTVDLAVGVLGQGLVPRPAGRKHVSGQQLRQV